MKGRKLNLAGMSFGSVTVISESGKNKYGSVMWEYECSCGTRRRTEGGSLTRGCVKSCGCTRYKFRGTDEEALSRSMFAAYKRSAAERGVEFCLTEDEFQKMFYDPCWYCGSIGREMDCGRAGRAKILANGIDRLDSEKGYEMGNCVPCCKPCNKLKGVFSVDEFLELCSSVASHRAKLKSMD